MLHYAVVMTGLMAGLPARAGSWVLPSVCPVCAGTGAYRTGPFCAACWSGLEAWGTACARCGRRIPAEGECGPCLLAPPAQEAMRHGLAYEGRARDAVHLWKFGGAWHLTEPFADLLLPLLESLPETFAEAPLTFIPPHPWRLLRKDFHPPLLLARALGARTGRPVVPLLAKTSLRRPQTALPRKKRLTNVRGTFALRGDAAPPEALLLVDDIATTGATLREAVAVLVRGGVRRAAALSLARTP